MLASPRILTLAAIIGVLGSGAAAVALVGPDPGYRGVAGLSGSGRRPAGSAQAAPAQAERREAPARTGQTEAARRGLRRPELSRRPGGFLDRAEADRCVRGHGVAPPWPGSAGTATRRARRAA